MRFNGSHLGTTRHTLSILSILLGFLGLSACGSDGPSVTGPDLNDLVGTYALTQLTFDPQGALPEVDLLAVLGTSPDLIVASDKQAQIVYQDTISGLFTTISATAKTTKTSLRLTFSGNSSYADLILSRTMDFTVVEGISRLVFDGEAPDGARRQKLTRLVQDWQDEQLFDPVPGRLKVTFTLK